MTWSWKRPIWRTANGVFPAIRPPCTAPGNTPTQSLQTDTVKVTAAHHPLCGQHLPVVRFQRFAGQPAVVVMHPDGSRLRLPLEWTSAASPELTDTATTDLCLSVSGLEALADWLDHRSASEGASPDCAEGLA